MSGSRLRVAWLGHKSAKLGGGMATYSREITAGLRRKGLQVTFFHHGDWTGQPRDGATEDEESVPLDSISLVKTVILSTPRAKRKLADRLRRHEFDVVHASFWFSSLDFDLPKLCRELGIPFVATFHVAFDRRRNVVAQVFSAAYRLYAPALKQCDRVIVFGASQRDVLLKLGVPARTLLIIPNGVDVEKYSPGPSDRKRRFGAERLFLFMGRVDAEKNVDVLLEAFLHADPPASTKLLIMGSGTERRRLERFYRDRRVIFTGHIAEESERIAILRAADAFLLPSSVEGLSLSMLEAMSCGVATVATDVGSDGEALGGAGIVIDPSNLSVELEMAIRQLLDLPFLIPELGRLARQRVLERFSLDRNLDGLIEVYEELVTSRRPAMPVRS